MSVAAGSGALGGHAPTGAGGPLELTVGDFSAPGVLKTYRGGEVLFTVKRGPSSLDVALRDAIHCVL